MITPEIQRVAWELEAPGYAVTSYDALGLELNLLKVTQLMNMVAVDPGSEEALKVVKHIVKNDMAIVQDPVCLALAAEIIAPPTDLLFAHAVDAGDEDKWSLFGINKYRAGGKFGPHVDKVGKSVLVITLAGERSFDICEKIPDETQADGFSFGEVLDNFVLNEGSILVLDREADPGHAVAEALTDGVVAVADALGIIRLPRP